MTPTGDYAADRLVYPTMPVGTFSAVHAVDGPFAPFTPLPVRWSVAGRLAAIRDSLVGHFTSPSLLLDLRTDTLESDNLSVEGWEPDVLLALAELQQLPDDWDGYGGVAVSSHHAQAAWKFLDLVLGFGVPLPDFVPLGDGGVQLEWDDGARRVSFTTEPESDPEIWISDATEDRLVSSAEALGLLVTFRR